MFNFYANFVNNLDIRKRITSIRANGRRNLPLYEIYLYFNIQKHGKNMVIISTEHGYQKIKNIIVVSRLS